MNDFDAPWKAHRDELYARAVSRGKFLQWRRRATIAGAIVVALALPLAAAGATSGSSRRSIDIEHPHGASTTTVLARSRLAVRGVTTTLPATAPLRGPVTGTTPGATTPTGAISPTNPGLPDPCSNPTGDFVTAISFDVSHVEQGQEVGYTLTLTNPTDRVADTLPSDAMSIEVTSDNSSPSASGEFTRFLPPVTHEFCGFTIGLAPHESFSFHGTLTVPGPGDALPTDVPFTGPANARVVKITYDLRNTATVPGSSTRLTVDPPAGTTTTTGP